MSRYLTVAVALTLVFLGTSASTGAGQSATTYGPAAQSCGTWTNELSAGVSAKTSPAGIVLQSWMSGYITAASVLFPLLADTKLAPTDSAGINRWVTNYCAEHPLDDLLKAAMSLVAELIARGKK